MTPTEPYQLKVRLGARTVWDAEEKPHALGRVSDHSHTDDRSRD